MSSGAGLTHTFRDLRPAAIAYLGLAAMVIPAVVPLMICFFCLLCTTRDMVGANAAGVHHKRVTP